MNENKDYVSHLNKARKKRNQKWDPRYLLLAIVVVLLIGLGVLAAVNVKSAVSGKAARKSDNVIEERFQCSKRGRREGKRRTGDPERH